MRTVLILGAGATLAEAIRQRGSRRRGMPPLDRGFFGRMREAGASPQSLRDVASYMANLHGINIMEGEDDRLEAVLVSVVSDVRLGKCPVDVFVGLMGLYAEGIAQTTGWIRPNARSYLYRYFAHLLLTRRLTASEITIVTFNQDLEIEKTLERMSRVRRLREGGTLIALPHSYGPVAVGARRFGPGNVPRFATEEDEPESFVEILKLHGSLNWASIHDSRAPGFSELMSSDRELRWTSRASVGRTLQVNEGGQQRYAIPFVVPPVSDKASLFPSEIIDLWDLAEFYLEDATEVIVYGYSCPQTDAEAASLFRRALKANQDLREITIVNPDSAVAGRFASFVPGVAFRYYASADAWLSSTVDGGSSR